MDEEKRTDLNPLGDAMTGPAPPPYYPPLTFPAHPQPCPGCGWCPHCGRVTDPRPPVIMGGNSG